MKKEFEEKEGTIDLSKEFEEMFTANYKLLKELSKH